MELKEAHDLANKTFGLGGLIGLAIGVLAMLGASEFAASQWRRGAVNRGYAKYNDCGKWQWIEPAELKELLR